MARLGVAAPGPDARHGTWYRDHLDHQLPILTSAAGPFADCDPTRHFPPETDRLTHTPAPIDWWPPAT